MKSMKQEITDLFQQQLIRSICPEFQYYKFISMLNNYPWLNYSLGCMFGCFIGDSLGAYVEFAKKLDKTIIDQAMNMTPGGTFNLRAGQVTDDSQMSFHLLEALLKTNLNLPFDEQKTDLIFNIAEQYVSWKHSKPFDIGITCRNGIQTIQQIIKECKPKKTYQKQQCIKKITKKIRQINYKSQSNGSLMKITPFIFFGIAISEKVYIQKSTRQLYKELVQSQIKLIHSNQTIINSSLLWFKTLWHICTRENNDMLKKIYDYAMQVADKKLKQWAIEVQSKNSMDARINQGWAKIAWSFGMKVYKLLKEALEKDKDFQLNSSLYKSLIRSVIQLGGDTDTNAAIIGGLIGSIIGFKNLPKDYLSKMFSVNFADKNLKRGQDRPDFYEPRKVFAKIYRFLLKLNLETHIKMPKY